VDVQHGSRNRSSHSATGPATLTKAAEWLSGRAAEWLHQATLAECLSG